MHICYKLHIYTSMCVTSHKVRHCKQDVYYNGLDRQPESRSWGGEAWAGPKGWGLGVVQPLPSGKALLCLSSLDRASKCFV